MLLSFESLEIICEYPVCLHSFLHSGLSAFGGSFFSFFFFFPRLHRVLGTVGSFLVLFPPVFRTSYPKCRPVPLNTPHRLTRTEHTFPVLQNQAGSRTSRTICLSFLSFTSTYLLHLDLTAFTGNPRLSSQTRARLLLSWICSRVSHLPASS